MGATGAAGGSGERGERQASPGTAGESRGERLGAEGVARWAWRGARQHGESPEGTAGGAGTAHVHLRKERSGLAVGLGMGQAHVPVC